MSPTEKALYEDIATIYDIWLKEANNSTSNSEVILGVIHSMLVILDGGTSLSDHYSLTLTDGDGNELPKHLHEVFMDYLNDY